MNTTSGNQENTDTLVFETEEEEDVRLSRERYLSDSIVYSELGVYNGIYILDTESEGVEATLEIKYLGDKTFDFILGLSAPIVPCKAKLKGKVYMDQTQHGFYQGEGCFLHFNFMGSWGGSMVIEVDQEDSCKEIEGECSLGGRYLRDDS